MKKEPLAIALGFFDGVHKGHGELMKKVAKHPNKSAVLTFDCHPGTLLGQETVPLLSTSDDRTWVMQHYYQIQQVIVANFSQICTMDWDFFLEDFLQKQWNVTHIVVGHDFRFGKSGLGTPEKLEVKCKELNMTCEVVPPVLYQENLVSSTLIRNLLESEKLDEANQFLGHPHTISNKVQHGNKIGSNVLGFPTVNLSVPQGVIVPSYGVYACRCWVGDTVYNAVTNIGIRPTVDDNNDITVEGFLLDFPGDDLYGSYLRMEFYQFIRGEKKFKNFSALTAQIEKDVNTTKEYFKNKLC